MVLSNHCALAELIPIRMVPATMPADSGAQHHCCHRTPQPTKDQKPRPAVPTNCCKTLTVLMPDGAKVPAAPLFEMALVPMLWVDAVVWAVTVQEGAPPWTGPPPDWPSFCDLVLNRSLQA